MAAPLVLAGSATAVTSGHEYALTPDAALIVMEDGSGCILDMGGDVYAVAPVGTTMLRWTLEHGTAAAATHVATAYSADLARVQADLRTFLADLERRGVLGHGGRLPGRMPRWSGARIAAAALEVFFRLSRSTRARAATALTLARLSFGLFGWTATVSSWQKRVPVAEAPSLEGIEALVSSIDEAVRSAAARHVMGVDCKERALSCWAMARAAGLPATVVVGVELYPLSGHCWCEIGPSIVGDDPQRCRRYAPVFRYE